MLLRQWVFVIISTAQHDDGSSRRKSDCWLLRCVGPTRARGVLFHAPVVTTNEVNTDPFAGANEVTEAGWKSNRN